MSTIRIALASLPFPATPEEALTRAMQAVEDATRERAEILCFPEAYVPGYRAPGKRVSPADPRFLERAWSEVGSAAARARVAVVLGTERLLAEKPTLTALVLDRDGARLGFQDKVQLDPSEEPTYAAGDGRRLFQVGALTFGIVICHEGWRYPETVRWAAQRGAQLVFHPHFHEAEPGSFRPTRFADPQNSFHEKALLCRAAENTCWIASANCASPGAPTTSAIVRPDGTLLAHQPYGEPGLLVAELDLDAATGLLARRCRAPYA
ncbi:MAG TPA: carbon-nitrogen hydrolase family protein [Planctomycetota bacterium]